VEDDVARFSGQTAVITGGSTGLGLGTARFLADAGATVVISGRNIERGEAAASQIRDAGGAARFVQCDVGDDAQVAHLIDEALAAGGSIDLFFANAGVEGPFGAIADWKDDEVAEVLATNIKGVLSGLRHATPHMPTGSLVVLNASFVGPLVPISVSIPYAATKSAVVTIGRGAAGALEDQGVRVVSVCPWIFDTPMVDRLTGGAGLEAREEFAAAWTPSGHLGRPEEFAEVIADLWDGTLAAKSGDALLVDAGPTVTPLPG
jgi:NAD(P)-dependent dehydrogenase (short-subunit alcohol dehydrogenase family)